MNLSGSIRRFIPVSSSGYIDTRAFRSPAVSNRPQMHRPEAVLRHIWSRQFLHREKLATVCGRSVQVLHPGTLNHNAGPDFRDALIVVGGIRYRGDVEFHRTPEDWIAHGHGRDPGYNGVILHVVLESGRVYPSTRAESGREIPLLLLRPFLCAPLEKIIEHMEREESEIQRSPLACASRNDRLSATELRRIIIEYGAERLSAKAQTMAGRLAELCRDEIGVERSAFPGSSGSVPDACLQRGRLNDTGIWEEMLAEGIMDGLGYSRNREPFRRLSRILSMTRIRTLPLTSVAEIESVLFHISGLMPAAKAVEHPAEKSYVHMLSGIWKDLSSCFSETIHAAEWTISPARPSNLPTLRIAAAARLLFAIAHEQLLDRLIRCCGESGLTGAERAAAMESLLHIKDDAFWSRHYSFAEPSRTPHALIGLSRRRDIVINTVIPLLFLYADVFHKDKHLVAAAAFAIGPLEENAVTRRMERQLIKGRYRTSSGIEQQGLLHLYRNHCSQRACETCRIHAAITAA